MSKDPKFPPMPARLDPFGREEPKTEIVGVFENKREAALHTYGYSEAQRLFVRDTGIEPSWQAGFEAGLVWGAAIVAMALAIRRRQVYFAEMGTDYEVGYWTGFGDAKWHEYEESDDDRGMQEGWLNREGS